MVSFNLKNEQIVEYCVRAIRDSLGKVVTIQEPKRSRDQNAYYWAILEVIGKDIGEGKEDLHDILKMRVFGPQHITVRGETISIPKRSSDLSVKDFSRLVDAASMLAASFNIVLPAPADYGWEK